jgi:molybdopterin-guanine dinucleotide biosynthesis protein MobB
MVQLPPTVCVLGFSESGKTTVAAYLTQHLAAQKLRVLTAKHVGQATFTLDHPGTDSYRLSQAGAVSVLLHSDATTSLLLSRPAHTLSELLSVGVAATPADVIILEGFRPWTQHQSQIAKVVCVRSGAEAKELTADLEGEVLAICSLKPGIPKTLHIPDKLLALARNIDRWLACAEPLTHPDQ